MHTLVHRAAAMIRGPGHRHYAALRQDRPAGAPAAACLAAPELAMLAEGRADADADADARMRLLAHVAECEWCRRSLASIVRALADAGVAHAAEPATPAAGGRRRHTVRVALPAIAAALLVAAIVPRWRRDPPLAHRAAVITQTASPVPVFPVGTVPAADRFDWSAVPGADAYRVSLHAAGGQMLYERTVMDTSLVLPDSVRLRAGETYLWRVDARAGFDRWSSSPLVRVSVGATRSPRSR